MDKRNPFPGMNPSMEQTWPDVDLRLIGSALDALGVELPEDLVAPLTPPLSSADAEWVQERLVAAGLGGSVGGS